MAHAKAMPIPDLLAGDAGEKRRGVWPDALRRLSRNRPAMISLFVLGAIFVLAALGNYVDVIQRYDPAALNYEDGTKTGPSWDHFLGQDHLGRDTWARVLQGTWISLRVGLGVAAIAFVVGVLVGGAAALTQVGGLSLHRRRLGRLMLYELSPFSEPLLLWRFYDPDAPGSGQPTTKSNAEGESP